MSDDTEDLAMMAVAMKKQRDAMKSLFTAVEGKLGALTEALTAGAVKEELGAIESALADITAALEGGSATAAIEALVDAVGRIKPTVTVNVPDQAAPNVTVQVNPTPVTFEAVMPPMPEQPAPVVHIMPASEKGATWEVRIPGYGGAERVMKITRTA